MPDEIKELVAKFEDYIRSTRHEYPSFCVRLGEDALERLKAHKVDLQGRSWSMGEAFHPEAAWQVVRHFLDLGCEGGGGGDDGSVQVYVYLITHLTDEGVSCCPRSSGGAF